MPIRLPAPPSLALAITALVGVICCSGLPTAKAAVDPTPSRGQVVVLRTATVDELTRTALARIIGELTAARFQVTIVPLDPNRDPTPQVETVAPELAPVAAFALVRSPDSSQNTITIWVCDRLGHRTTIQRVKMTGADVSQDAEVLAVEAIELIRVSIAGLWPSHGRAGDLDVVRNSSSRASTSPGPDVDAPATNTAAPATGAELTMGLGVSGLHDISVPSTEWLAALDATVKWPIGVALRAQLRGLGPAATVSGKTYGAAQVSRQMLMLGMAWVFWPEERVRSMLSLSAGAEYLEAKGAADDVQRVRTQDVWALLVSAGAGASLRLGRHLALGLEIDAIVELPPVTLTIGNTRTKSLSLPGVLTNVVLQSRF